MKFIIKAISMQKLFNSQISQFSFFEFIGVLTCGTVLSNYFLDKPLINIGIFFGYCLVGSVLSISKLLLYLPTQQLFNI